MVRHPYPTKLNFTSLRFVDDRFSEVFTTFGSNSNGRSLAKMHVVRLYKFRLQRLSVSCGHI